MLTSHSSCPGGSASRPQLAAKCTYPSLPVYPRGCSFNVVSSSSGPAPAHPLGGSTGNIKDGGGCPATLAVLPTLPFPAPSSFLALLCLSFQPHSLLSRYRLFRPWNLLCFFLPPSLTHTISSPKIFWQNSLFSWKILTYSPRIDSNRSSWVTPSIHLPSPPPFFKS